MSVSENEKRKLIRSYFFHKQYPEDPGCLLGGLEFIGNILWLFDTSPTKGEQPKTHPDRVKEYEDTLNRWGLTPTDLANRPSTTQIDTWLAEDLSKVTQIALEKLGLVREELVRDPLVIYGPLIWKTPGIPDEDLVTVSVSDGTLRFSCYQLVVVCLSEARIATYSANFNFLRYAFVGEKTVEYLYQDIVSVSTEEKSTNYTLPSGQILRTAQIFRIAVPSGDNIEVVISSSEIKNLLGGTPKESDHDQSVRVIREMMRQKQR